MTTGPPNQTKDSLSKEDLLHICKEQQEFINFVHRQIGAIEFEILQSRYEASKKLKSKEK